MYVAHLPPDLTFVCNLLTCCIQYRGWNADEAVKDYWSRIRDQERFYEPIIEFVEHFPSLYMHQVVLALLTRICRPIR